MPESAGQYVGASAIALAFIAFIRLFLMRQISDLRDDVADLREQITEIERKYDQERGDKHKARNDVARSVMALELVRRLAKQCTCGVLEPVIEIIDRLFAEFETLANRRHDDPPQEGATP